MTGTKEITLTAAKFAYKKLVERNRAGEDTSQLSFAEIVEQHDLWLVDEWTHVGYCVLTCLENEKIVQSYCKGKTKVLDSLIGKTLKSANMTVDPELIRDLMPLIIDRHFRG